MCNALHGMSVCASHLLKERVLCILSTISLKKDILNFYYYKKKVHKDERNAAFFFKPGRRILILVEQTKGKEFFLQRFCMSSHIDNKAKLERKVRML